MVSEASGQQDHKTNTKLFLKVFAALCLLTAISFVIANSPLMKSQGLAWAVMMLVSCAKAFLVISFFMHLKWERTWKYVLTLPASLMSLLLVVALILLLVVCLRWRDMKRIRLQHFRITFQQG